MLLVKQPRDPKRKSGTIEPTALAAELEPGQTRKETEGVFVLRSGIIEYVPVKVGIAGEEHFEVVDGLKVGDSIVAGPYQAIRDMRDSTRVKQQEEKKGPEKKGPGA